MGQTEINPKYRPANINKMVATLGFTTLNSGLCLSEFTLLLLPSCQPPNLCLSYTAPPLPPLLSGTHSPSPTSHAWNASILHVHVCGVPYENLFMEIWRKLRVQCSARDSLLSSIRTYCTTNHNIIIVSGHCSWRSSVRFCHSKEIFDDLLCMISTYAVILGTLDIVVCWVCFRCFSMNLIEQEDNRTADLVQIIFLLSFL